MNQDRILRHQHKTNRPRAVYAVEFISKEYVKLKSDVEEKLPKIDSIDSNAQFLEERIIDVKL